VTTRPVEKTHNSIGKTSPFAAGFLFQPDAQGILIHDWGLNFDLRPAASSHGPTESYESGYFSPVMWVGPAESEVSALNLLFRPSTLRHSVLIPDGRFLSHSNADQSKLLPQLAWQYAPQPDPNHGTGVVPSAPDLRRT
jgi:hypothetical protein